MKSVHKSVLLWFSAEEMFDLVTDVPSYPLFLPWCERGTVRELHHDGMVAEIAMALGSFRHSFTTRNVHRPGRQVKLTLVDGPFKQLYGTWDFTPVGEGQRACRVELSLDYSFNRVLGVLVGPIFDRIADSLVDAFVKRAEQVYT